ncbi:MAG: PIN domain-containing protein [Gammaproteobacteria bacterium]|nr:PIN domain-containing protein [Gammaproteobacteria bacterium]
MIFIDTSAFIARYIEKDLYHAIALEKWGKIAKINGKIFTSNFVLDEMFTLLARKVSYQFAAEKADFIYSSHRLVILRPTLTDELLAVRLFKKYADQKVSFTDCVTFSLMRQQHLKKIFAFDRHFSLAGFVYY